MSQFDTYLFNIDIPTGTPETGKLLVAEPFLREEHFCHAVILLLDHEPERATMGIVTNHPTTYTIDQLLPAVKRPDPVKVYCGGPVSTDRLYFVHTLGDLFPGARPICDGLWIGGDFDAVVRYVSDGYPVDGVLRFFLGYSGWEPGQLTDEIDSHVWAVTAPPAPELLLSNEGDTQWHMAVRLLGESHKAWRMYPRNLQSN